MTKIFDIVHLNEHMYVVDGKSSYKDWYIGKSGLNVWHEDVTPLSNDRKIIFTTNPSLGLPLLPVITQSLELQIVEILKRIFVTGQQFELAGIVRDYQRKLSDSKPIQVEIEMELPTKNMINKARTFIDNNEINTLDVKLNPIIENGFVKIKKWIYEINRVTKTNSEEASGNY